MKCVIFDRCPHCFGKVKAALQGWHFEIINTQEEVTSQYALTSLFGGFPHGESIGDSQLVVISNKLGEGIYGYGFALAIRGQFPNIPIVMRVCEPVDQRLVLDLSAVGIHVEHFGCYQQIDTASWFLMPTRHKPWLLMPLFAKLASLAYPAPRHLVTE